MSFLNSVLSSIGGGVQSTSQATITNASNASTTVSSRPAQQSAKDFTLKTGPNQVNAGLDLKYKRKAEDELQRIASKVPRTDTTQSAHSVQPSAQPKKIRTAVAPVSSTVSPTVSSASLSYRGTAKPSTAPSTSAVEATSTKAPPKKGSFAETLARAKAVQSTAPQVGTIKHKPLEKINKKEKSATQAGSPGKLKDEMKGRKDMVQEKAKGCARAVKKGDDKPIKKRVPIDTGYKGTARPKPETSAYKGTMNRPSAKPNKPLSEDRHSDRSRSTSVVRQAPRYRYAEDSDEDDEDKGYDTEGSSDMEAAVHEVDEEEEMAEKVARKEDLREAMEEMRLKKEKEAKRKNLQMLALKKR